MITVCEKQNIHDATDGIGQDNDPEKTNWQYPPVRWESVGCNMCGSDDTELYHKERLIYFDQELDFQIVRCSNCSLVYTNPRLADYNALYLCDESYTDQSSDEHASAKSNVFAGAMDQIEKYHRAMADVNERPLLLDVGCGSGHFMEMAKARGYRVSGIEPSKRCVEYIEKNFDLPVVNANIMDADVPAESVDVITAWDVIEHVDDPKAMLGRCAQWLRPGGVMALRFPSASFQKIKGVVLNQILRTKHPAFGATMHLYFFNEDTFTQMANSVGLEIVAVKTTPMEMNAGSMMINVAKKCVGVTLSAMETISRRHLGNLEIFCRKPG